MRKYYLLPHRYERIGWVMFLVSVLIIIAAYFLDVLPPMGDTTVFTLLPSYGRLHGFLTQNDSWWDEIGFVMLYVSLYFISMSSLKKEDEMTLSIRLRSLVWALTTTTILLVVVELFVYGFGFLYVMMFQGIFIFLVYILRFKYMIYKMKKENNEE